MYSEDKRAIIKAALELKENKLIALSGGNVSVRKENGDYIVTPSGMAYEGMVEDDLIVFNKDGKIIEGHRRPSVDTVALEYIYQNMPEVNAIIHTHQIYATAAGLIADQLPVATTTLSNVTLGAVNVAPYSSPGASRWDTNGEVCRWEKSSYTQTPRRCNDRGQFKGSALCCGIYGNRCKDVSGCKSGR